VTTLNGSNGFRIQGIAGDNSGLSVSSAGDINNDGFADLIVSAPGADPNGKTDAGSSFVVFGKAAGFGASFDLATLDGTNGFRLDGVSAGDSTGFEADSAGDVNDDGYDDLLIGAPRADGKGDFTGANYVVFGRPDGFAATIDLSTLDGTNGFSLEGAEFNTRSGWSLSLPAM
jgi:hypothetical protein